MVFMCLSLSVFSTIEEYEAKAGIVLFYMETVVVIWFAIEFFLRLVNVLSLNLFESNNETKNIISKENTA